MTLRDYLFNQINENKVYICTTKVPSDIIGEWIYWGGSCICPSGGNACSTTDWLGFDGCVEELKSFGVTCSATTPCTIDRLCTDQEIMLVMKATDTSDVLYKHINDVCLDSCADLAGFGDFATLVALAATAGVLPAASLLGLFSASFGSTAGVPAALIPGNPRFISISIEPILICLKKFFHSESLKFCIDFSWRCVWDCFCTSSFISGTTRWACSRRYNPNRSIFEKRHQNRS